MKVVCVGDKSFLPGTSMEINYDNSTFGILIIGSIYTATLVRGNTNYYYIEEFKKFIPASLFIKIEDMREAKLNELGI
jgi:hypothetical protein